MGLPPFFETSKQEIMNYKVNQFQDIKKANAVKHLPFTNQYENYYYFLRSALASRFSSLNS